SPGCSVGTPEESVGVMVILFLSSRSSVPAGCDASATGVPNPGKEKPSATFFHSNSTHENRG
ncbi:MAG TPA: hypothetical protein VFF72_09240, partial [Caldimonas sp.]|nr:hypothetical protein [Caldimonas sp.]